MNLSPRITYACAMDACLHASQWRWTILQLTFFPGRSDVITEILVVAAHVQVGNDVVSDQGTNNSNLTGIWKVTFTNERCLWDVDSIDSKWVFFWTCYHYLLGLVSLCITNRDWICVDVLRPIWPGATTKAARTQTQISIKKTNKQTNKQASKQTISKDNANTVTSSKTTTWAWTSKSGSMSKFNVEINNSSKSKNRSNTIKRLIDNANKLATQYMFVGFE